MEINNLVASLRGFALRDMLIVPETSDLFMSQIAQHASTTPEEGARLHLESRSTLELAYGFDDSRDSDQRKPFVYSDGLAVIPIHGTLLNRFGGSWGFVTGYNFIRRQMNAALDDDDVEQIIFDVDSPGGEASGCFELAREIMASRRVKPSLAMVDSLAASGGMALAGAATQMYGIPSARIGSIGVYRMHISVEGALKQQGVKITFATAGEHKIDGSPYKDLPQAVLDEWTESAGKTWDDFIALVAESRDMSEAAVRDTQARIYRADEALALGLINAVKTTTEAVPHFVAELAEDSTDEEEDDMADAANKPKEVTSAAVDYDRIGTMISTAVSAMATSMNRASSITGCAEAKGKPKLAAALAADTSISLETAKSLLSAAAVETKGKAPKIQADDDDDDDDLPEDVEGDDDEDGDDDGDDDEDGEEAARAARKGSSVKGKRRGDTVNHLDAAMKGSKQPNLGGGNGKGQRSSAQPTDSELASSLLADHSLVAGAAWSKPKTAH